MRKVCPSAKVNVPPLPQPPLNEAIVCPDAVSTISEPVRKKPPRRKVHRPACVSAMKLWDQKLGRVNSPTISSFSLSSCRRLQEMLDQVIAPELALAIAELRGIINTSVKAFSTQLQPSSGV